MAAFQSKDWSPQGYTRLSDNIWENPEGYHFSEVDGIMRQTQNLSPAQARRVGVTPDQLQASTEHNKTLQEELAKKRGAVGQKKLEEGTTPTPRQPAVKKENGAPPAREEAEPEHVDAEIVRVGEEQEGAEALAVASDIVRPVVTVAQAMHFWNEYVKLTKAILQQGDYLMIRGKPFKKKSAWRKYERFFNLSVPLDTVRMVQDNDEQGRITKAQVWLEMVAPNGRRSPGWAACTVSEKGHEQDKTNDRGQVTCKGPCDGRVHFSNPEHDIPATAMTRARNRACADIIGAGEVSAEEVKED